MTGLSPRPTFLVASALLVLALAAARTRADEPPDGPTFRHHVIDASLPAYTSPQGWLVGDYGASGLADFDQDGDLDFTIGRHAALGPSAVYWYEYQAADQWTRHNVGGDTPTDVGGEVMDVDQDGWMDIVHGGVWYRNTSRPREEPFERHVYDPDGGGAHDVVAADVDGDGTRDIITLYDRGGLHWYKVPGFHKHFVTAGIHGGVAPAGAGDLDGDGDTDLVRTDIWLDNVDGKGRQWREHRLPFGKDGPFGISSRSWIADLDADGDNDIAICDCDRSTEAEIAWLENGGGSPPKWTRYPLGRGIDFHSLVVADFNGDGRPDIFSCDAETAAGPWRWRIWQNTGLQEGRFRERAILDARLGGHETRVGDVDGDGDLDLVSKPWSPVKDNALGGKMHVDYLENLSRD